MDKMMTKTVDALQRFGERIERRLSTGDEDPADLNRSGSGNMFSNSGSAFHRPTDKKYSRQDKYQSPKERDLIYGGARNYSSDNLAASPGYNNSFNNYRQNPRPNPYQGNADRAIYGTGLGNPINYGYGAGYGGGVAGGMIPGPPGSVGYAPDYYIAERRQLELVPAPPPRVVQQSVPYPVPVDRPVPQPYPVQVPRPVPVDRPVPYAVPQPVPVDRPVPVPVRVPVPSPPPPPVQIPVPVPVPSPVPCYIPVGVPVPSPPPSPVMFENSVTYSQRYITGSPVVMNQQRYLAGSPAMGVNPCIGYGNRRYF